MSEIPFNCCYCTKQACIQGNMAQAPANCPGEEDTSALYDAEDILLAKIAAQVEQSGYGKHTRVEEIMDFARRAGYHKIGLAFCTGLQAEAKIFAKILRANGFEVVSVICKNGSVDKSEIGITEAEKLQPGFEAMCNPVRQAKLLAAAGAEFNVILGLCVGHDTLFIKHSSVPVTVLAVKDRVLAHNPLGAIYQADAYYKRLYHFFE